MHATFHALGAIALWATLASLGLALQHQVTLQHAVAHRAGRQQPGLAAPGGPELLQTHKGCHQLHGRARLQGPLRGVFQVARAGRQRRHHLREQLARLFDWR